MTMRAALFKTLKTDLAPRLAGDVLQTPEHFVDSQHAGCIGNALPRWPKFSRTCIVLGLAAGALLALAIRAEDQAAGTKPNIVYVLADDMGYGDGGFNGCRDIRTPQLDKLAQDGAVLESFYVQPCCSPTRASLMSGRHVSHTGVYGLIRFPSSPGLPLAERTLAQALHEAGYATAICGKWHLGEAEPGYLPLKRGFDHQYGLRRGGIDYFSHNSKQGSDWFRDDQPIREEGYATHLITREACRLIREKPAGRPLFLYVPYNAVHSPHQVPDSYKEPYAELPEPRRTYAGMVAALDEAVGQIYATLQETGLVENTLFIFSSDNGGPSPGTVTSNEPLRDGKFSLYEGGVRVCAFATWPGHIPAGQRIKEPLHIVDWYPTLVNLAGGSLKQQLPPDGCDIWPVLTRSAKSPRDALLLPFTTEKAAIRSGDWKMLARVRPGDDDSGGLPFVKGVELYNLEKDIGEKTNVVAEHPDVVKDLETKFAQLLKDAVPPLERGTAPERRKKG